MTKLRLRLTNRLKVRNYSHKTIESYVHAVASLAQYYGRSPDRVTSEEIQAYLLYLMENRKLAWSSVNVAFSAFRFFYIHILGWKETYFTIGPRKTARVLPTLLSKEELERLFECANTLKRRVLLMTTYSAGLRVGEVVRLNLCHIESSRMMIRVEGGKGRKDRYTVLSDRLLDKLRGYYRAYRPKVWLFPGGRDPQTHLSVDAAQRAFYAARDKAGLRDKCKGIHTLRHCFGTHLLEAGVDLTTIQRLMGHSSLLTTMKYLHITQKRLGAVRSPLDLIGTPEPEMP